MALKQLGTQQGVMGPVQPGTGLGFVGPTQPNVNLGSPVVSADDYMTSEQPIQLPTYKTPSDPTQFVNNLTPVVNQSNQGLVRAETEEARKRDDVLNRLLNQDQFSSQDLYNSSFKGAGGDRFLADFTDANTKLAVLQGKFNTAKQAVSGSTGQSQVQEGFSLNEIGRQQAVEVGNQALVVQALQGNLNTARQIAMDTVNFAVEDRQANLQNLLAQYDALDGIVSRQEQQIIDANKFEAEKELADLEYTRDLSLEAISSGLATVEEMQQLTNPRVPNSVKQATAQRILGQLGAENRQIALDDRELDRQIKLSELMSNLAGEPVDTQVVEVNGKKLLINSQTGQTIADLSGEQSTEAVEVALTQAQDKINGIDSLLTENSGLNSAVGPNAASRATNFFTKLFSADTYTGARSDFIAGVEQLREQLTLDKLVEAKQSGATFGALSDGERQTLSAAASKLGTWAIKDKNGNVIGYNASQKDFKAELDRINNYAKLDYILKGGSPETVGIQITPDGGVWTQNSDGSMVQLRSSLPQQNFNSVGKTSASTGNTPYLKTLGAITGLDGSPYWKYGLDIDLKVGDPVKSPVSGKVISAATNGGFGKQVKIQDSTGRVWALSHLDGYNVKPGQTISAGTVIGKGGKTGNVIPMGGSDGSHLDVTVYQNGKPIAARQVKSLLDQIRV